MDIFTPEIAPVVGVISLIVSIISVLVAIVQTYRYNKLKRMGNTQLWGTINLIIRAFDRLEKIRHEIDHLDDLDAEIKRRIHATRDVIVATWLRLLEQAVLDEKRFTEETIMKWIGQGRLATEWRQRQARTLIEDKH